MSKFLQSPANNKDANAIAIPQVFSKNSQSEKTCKLKICSAQTTLFCVIPVYM